MQSAQSVRGEVLSILHLEYSTRYENASTKIIDQYAGGPGLSFENLGKAWSRGGIVGREERPRDRSCHPRPPLQRPHQVTKPPPKLPASLCSEILPVIFLLYFPMQSAMLCPSYPTLLFLHALFCSPLQCLEMPSNGLHPGSPKQTAPASSPTAAEHHLPPDLFLAASTYI